MKIPSVRDRMAAGRGTRMRSQLPKALHPLCGRPLILWPVEAAREAGAERVVVVVGREGEDVRRVLLPGVEIVVQDPPAGRNLRKTLRTGEEKLGPLLRR